MRLDNTVFLKLAHPAERLVKVKVGIPLHAIGQGDLDGLVCCRGKDGMNAQVEFPAFWKAQACLGIRESTVGGLAIL